MILTLPDDRTFHTDIPALAAEIARGALEAAESRHPLIVAIREAWSHEVLVGLQGNRGFIQVASSSGDPPYWATFNPEAAHSREEVVDFFLLGQHHTPIPVKHLVAESILWPALDAFLAAGVRSPRVNWRSV